MNFLLNFDKRFFKNFDYTLAGLLLLLTAIGIVTIIGSTANVPHLEGFGNRQIVWACISIAVFVFLLAIDYRVLAHFAIPFYIVINLLLVYLLIKGHAIKGSASWISFGSIRFQPSEFAKIATVLLLARHLKDRMGKLNRFRDLAVPFAVTALPMALIMLQPDLGSAFILLPILSAMLFAAGVRKKIIVILVVVGIACAVGYYPFLKSYQKHRIAVFFHPGEDPLGRGYNVFQSQIALGSGGAFGKGWKKGTQTALQFLPEHHTDFIYSSLCEQFGFVGGIVLLMLFLGLISRSLNIAMEAGDPFGSLIVIGLLAIFTTHVVLNIAMTVGLFPVAGIPLPFISYGGSFLLTSYSMFALICNVGMRKFMF